MIVSKNNSVKILSFNARSLLPTIDLLRALCLNELYDILIVTEIWLSVDTLIFEIRIPGFDIAGKDRHRHGGGVAIYIYTRYHPLFKT